jgi:hypothetical protein
LGITQQSLDRLNRYNCLQPGTMMLELGAQNLYDNAYYGQIAKDVFTSIEVKHFSIDIIPHQGAVACDLREPFDYDFIEMYGVVTNFGTLEHVDGSIYQALRNIHDACWVDGLMIHENPKTGNWPEHCPHYFTMDFWKELARVCQYDILEITEEAAMSNFESGWNICAVLRKTLDSMFISEKDFNKIYNKYVFKS